ncbi:hypothetical protein [Cloacibacterium sp.]|jgi:predicted tellurium resistance membrane protein TerC|uniref:hypothetical protein n=1 Tax=Cloacibacterium sp. TaxID=1913682 RepID=UPI0035B2645F
MKIKKWKIKKLKNKFSTDMTTFYKVFLVLFIIFIGVNLYAVDWNIGILHQENNKFLFSIVAAVLGILVTIVMNTWRKLAEKK